MAAFALDYQKLWLAGVFAGCSLIFGPLIFVTHTFNFEPTATKLWKKTNISFYRPCPTEAEEKKSPPIPEAIPPSQEEMYPNPYYYPPQQNDPTRPPQYYPQSGGYQPPQAPQPPIRPDPTPTSSQPFYNWLTDRNPTNLHKTEDILFRPQPS
uniref:Uncharacterized protein n=1 Tax=Panagrolaimus sp. ES5 TaxID=591445 RepID=A0AC34F0E0_9BILA